MQGGFKIRPGDLKGIKLSKWRRNILEHIRHETPQSGDLKERIKGFKKTRRTIIIRKTKRRVYGFNKRGQPFVKNNKGRFVKGKHKRIVRRIIKQQIKQEDKS